MKLLTLARDLRRRKAREKHALFVAEGVRAVEELVRSPVKVRGVLAIIDRLEGGRDALAARGYSLQTLLTIQDFGLEATK